jgi:hypothetical protein
MAGDKFFFFMIVRLPILRQFVEMMCNGKFMNKALDETCDYFDLLAENA